MSKAKSFGIGACAVGLTAALAFYGLQREECGRPTPVRVALAHRTAEARGFPAAVSTNQTPSARGTLPYVLFAEGGVRKSVRVAAEASGARVIGVLPPSAFLIEADGETLRKLSGDGRFAAAEEFLPGDKMSDGLAEAVRKGATAVEATLVALAPGDRDGLKEYVTANGGEILKGCLNGADTFRARVPAGLVGELAKRGDVRWMDTFARPRLLNDKAVTAAAMNVQEVWNGHGLTGKGQIVSTSDSGIDTGDVSTMHRDLANQICGYRRTDVSVTTEADVIGHGTHTAGSIVGDGTMSKGSIKGVAYGAKLWAWSCCAANGDMYLPDDISELFQPEQERWPTHIHSASWGFGGKGAYDTDCVNADDYAWSHPDVLPVFACGNSGTKTGSIDSPAAAKNVLAVGATQNANTQYFGYSTGDPTKRATYSGRGPCQDGRIKPDIAAPGTSVLSTRSHMATATYFGIGANTNYAYDCGTSMATPLTAGAVALVREWLVERRGFTNAAPTAALMKAVITGGAKGANVPDNNLGWGRVDLEETLFPSNRMVKLIDRIPFAEGAEISYEIETTNAAPLDVQLVWIDRAGTMGGAQTEARLINDLDLTVKGEGGETWLGNGGTTADRLNTTESVRIAKAAAGKYRVTVACPQVAYDHTDGGAAALYVRGAFADEETSEDSGLVSVTVQVESGDGSVSVEPAAGTYQYPKGATVAFAAPEEWAYERSTYGTAFARHAYLGFTGTGDAPAAGGADVRGFALAVSNDTTVTWHYSPKPTDYLFRNIGYVYDRFPGEPPLSEITERIWIANGTELTLRLPEDGAFGEAYTYDGPYWPPDGSAMQMGPFGYRLSSIFQTTTDEIVGGFYVLDEKTKAMPRTLTITMDQGVDFYCDYYNETETRSGLPFWWYRRHLWGGEELLGMDGTATGDPDGDGFANLAEYEDGTDPVDDTSFRFEINAFSPTGMTFTGSVKGKLIVERCERIGGTWEGVVTNAGPRTGTANTVKLPAATGANGFYRVTYETP